MYNMYNTWLTCILHRNIVSSKKKNHKSNSLSMSTGRNSPVDVLQAINIIEQMEIDRISVSELIFPQSRHKAKPS